MPSRVKLRGGGGLRRWGGDVCALILQGLTKLPVLEEDEKQQGCHDDLSLEETGVYYDVIDMLRAFLSPVSSFFQQTNRDTGMVIGDGVFIGSIETGISGGRVEWFDRRVGGLVNSRRQNRFHGPGADTYAISHHQLGLCGGFGRESGLDKTVEKGMGGETSGYGLAEINEGVTIDRRGCGGENWQRSLFRSSSRLDPFLGFR